jgi:ribosomal protein L40E/NADH pyrophosphatase NudC (nudix superfamily)
VIEIRDSASEQVIQAQLKPLRERRAASRRRPARAAETQRAVRRIERDAGIVACASLRRAFCEGVKFCGKCGNRSFNVISEAKIKRVFRVRAVRRSAADSKFCGRCGLNLSQSNGLPKFSPAGFPSNFPHDVQRPMKKICGRCGSVFPPNVKFCGRCGNNLLDFFRVL